MGFAMNPRTERSLDTMRGPHKQSPSSKDVSSAADRDIPQRICQNGLKTPRSLRMGGRPAPSTPSSPPPPRRVEMPLANDEINKSQKVHPGSLEKEMADSPCGCLFCGHGVLLRRTNPRRKTAAGLLASSTLFCTIHHPFSISLERGKMGRSIVLSCAPSIRSLTANGWETKQLPPTTSTAPPFKITKRCVSAI